MLFYIIFLGLLFTLINVKGKYKDLLFNTTYIGLILISIFRFDVGYDYPAYYNAYYPANGEFDIIDIFEPFSRLLILFCRFLGSPYWIMILFGILTYLFIYLTIKNWKYRSCALLIYVCFLWLPSIDIIRQSLAISILLYAYKYVIQDRFSIYCLYVALAVMFHTSALIGFIIYIIYHISNFKIIFLILLTSIILSQLALSIVSQFDIYTYVIENTLGTDSGNKLVLFYVLLYFLVCVLVWNQRCKYNCSIYKTLAVISFSFIFFFSIQGMSAWRIGLYFISLYIYILPIILKYYSANVKLAFSFILITFLLTHLLYSTFSNRSPYIPYDLIFFHLSDSYPTFR